MNSDNAEQGGSMAPKQAQASGGRLGQHDRPLWKVDRIAPERCVVCHPEDDEIDPEDGLRPSQLKRIHKCTYVDAGHELHLLATAEHLRMQRAHDVQDWPEPGYDSTTGLRRKPKSSWTPDTDTPPLEELTEDDAMKRRNMAMAAALAVAAAVPAAAMDDETKRAVSEHATARSMLKEPVWPDNGIAQRELGDGDDWLESLFVEYVDNRWVAWAVMRPNHGQAKAIDFFSGRVLDVTVSQEGAYVESFVDSQGVSHEATKNVVFEYKDPRPGGSIGDIDFSPDCVDVPEGGSYGWTFNVYRRIDATSGKHLWSKVPLHRCDECADGHWDGRISTALNLRDGTMLVSGGKYVFRLRQSDFSPMGDAPNLRIVDEVDLRRTLEGLSGKEISDLDAYLSDQLGSR